MLTPYFQLNQTDNKLLISVHAPYSNIADVEIYVDKDDFRFYSSPYYLRLHLPGRVVDCDEPPVKYDADSGQFNIELVKCVPGEHFDDLDLIAKFLSPQKAHRVNIKPDIQVLNSTYNSNDDDDLSNDGGDSSDEWLMNQETPSLISELAAGDLSKTKYGFGNKLQDVFRIVKDEFREIFDIINIEETSSVDRKKLREESEDEQFSDNHYLYDLMEPSTDLQEVLQHKIDYSLEVKLSTEELEKLKNFGNKEYLLTKEESWAACLSLVDILYGYAYDQRTTLGETTVESAWTINKLSSTLSWLQSFHEVKDVVVSCIRRSLCYPLFRHWTLSLKVLDDTIQILKAGNRMVLRCFLNIHDLFNKSEPRYILNQLYITDYCIWLQSDRMNNKLTKLSDLILEVKNSLSKSDVHLDIDVLEAAAYSTLEDDLTNDLNKINIKNVHERNELSSDSSQSLSSSSESSSSSSSESEDESCAETEGTCSSESELDSDDDPPTCNEKIQT